MYASMPQCGLRVRCCVCARLCVFVCARAVGRVARIQLRGIHALEHMLAKFLAFHDNMCSWESSFLGASLFSLRTIAALLATRTPQPPISAWLSILQPREAYPTPSQPSSAPPSFTYSAQAEPDQSADVNLPQRRCIYLRPTQSNSH